MHVYMEVNFTEFNGYGGMHESMYRFYSILKNGIFKIEIPFQNQIFCMNVHLSQIPTLLSIFPIALLEKSSEGFD